jgi:hypothetical protein
MKAAAGYFGRTRQAYPLDQRQLIIRCDLARLTLFKVWTHIELNACELAETWGELRRDRAAALDAKGASTVTPPRTAGIEQPHRRCTSGGPASITSPTLLGQDNGRSTAQPRAVSQGK